MTALLALALIFSVGLCLWKSDNAAIDTLCAAALSVVFFLTGLVIIVGIFAVWWSGDSASSAIQTRLGLSIAVEIATAIALMRREFFSMWPW